MKSGIHRKAEHKLAGAAFALVELLVIIAILSVLAALMLPVLSKAKTRARSTTCANHLRQMGLALQMYVDENQGKYPYMLCRSVPLPQDPAMDRWFGKLFPFYPIHWTNRSFHCPGYRGTIWVETAPGADHDPYGSYAYNWNGVQGYQQGVPTSSDCLGLGVVYDPGRETPAIPESQIRFPSEMLAIGESRFRRETPITDVNYADCVDGMFSGFLFDEPPDEGGILPARHGKSYNQLYCDGHVDAMDPWVLFNPTNTAVMWNSDHEPHPELWP